MEISSLDACPSHPLTSFGSSDAVISLVAGGAHASVVRLELSAGGCIGSHVAPTEQLFIVVAGAGHVRSGDSPPVNVGAGDVVLWQAGEVHETTSETGLTALVVESPSLEFRTQSPRT
jgi:quercetin dioxygenase-like cupin family protein